MILVAVPSDELTRQICFILASRGISIRTLIHHHADPDWIECLKNYGATPVAGDLRDPIFLSDLFLGVNAVICSPFFLSTGQVDLTGMFNLINAAAAAGVFRFVYLSFTGQHEDRSAQEKTKIEQWIIQSGVAYTILHESVYPALVNGPTTESNRQAMIKDLARLATQALHDPEQLNAIIEIGRPAGDPDDPISLEPIAGGSV